MATNITVFLTGDEEKAGRSHYRFHAAISLKLVKLLQRCSPGIRSRCAGSAGHDMASIARRSSYSWMLKTTGKTGHSAGVFGEAGFGAIYELARILDEFRQ